MAKLEHCRAQGCTQASPCRTLAPTTCNMQGVDPLSHSLRLSEAVFREFPDTLPIRGTSGMPLVEACLHSVLGICESTTAEE